MEMLLNDKLKNDLKLFCIFDVNSSQVPLCALVIIHSPY